MRGLRNVSPSPPVDDVTYGGLGDTVMLGHFNGTPPIGSHHANDGDVSLKQLGMTVPFSVGVASLDSHIGHVVSGIPKEEVLGVGASSVVAPMTNVFPFWDGTVIKFPHQAMDTHGFSADVDNAVGVLRTLGVSIQCSHPVPARVLSSAAIKVLHEPGDNLLVHCYLLYPRIVTQES